MWLGACSQASSYRLQDARTTNQYKVHLFALLVWSNDFALLSCL
jgi:hypothetical protein